MVAGIKKQYISCMSNVLEQIKARRLQLGLKQQDMHLQVGMSRQQYQRLESKGNPRLDTLELVAKGLRSELMLIPAEHLAAVQDLLSGAAEQRQREEEEAQALVDNPWLGLLEMDDD